MAVTILPQEPPSYADRLWNQRNKDNQTALQQVQQANAATDAYNMQHALQREAFDQKAALEGLYKDRAALELQKQENEINAGNWRTIYGGENALERQRLADQGALGREWQSGQNQLEHQRLANEGLLGREKASNEGLLQRAQIQDRLERWKQTTPQAQYHYATSNLDGTTTAFLNGNPVKSQTGGDTELGDFSKFDPGNRGHIDLIAQLHQKADPNQWNAIYTKLMTQNPNMAAAYANKIKSDAEQGKNREALQQRQGMIAQYRQDFRNRQELAIPWAEVPTGSPAYLPSFVTARMPPGQRLEDPSPSPPNPSQITYGKVPKAPIGGNSMDTNTSSIVTGRMPPGQTVYSPGSFIRKPVPEDIYGDRTGLLRKPIEDWQQQDEWQPSLQRYQPGYTTVIGARG